MGETLMKNDKRRSVKKFRVVEFFASVGGFRLGSDRWPGISASSRYSEELISNFKIVWSKQFEPRTRKRHDINSELSIRRQCELLVLHRSGLYYAPSVESEANLSIMRRLDEQYLKTPFYGYRIHILLLGEGYMQARSVLNDL